MSEPPDSFALADAAGDWRAAYVHVPFCAARCPYCDFAVVTPAEGGAGPALERYRDALLAEIDMEPEWGVLDAVYVGGGTPSRMAAADLAAVVGRLADRFGLAAGAEVSLEANPEDIDPATAAALVDAGFNRISLGIQSFDPAVLAALGRGHDPAGAARAIAAARAAGFGGVNVDLIFGTPGESPASWRATLERTLEAGIDHLSTYGLTVERGTALSRAVAAGAPEPDPDDQADKYEVAASRAAAFGLVHYEVSNYAAPGHACRYNLTTWAQGEYLAFGLGAHGHRAGVRRRNVRRFDRYLEMVEAGRRPEAGADRAGPWERELERVYLGVRRRAGVVAGVGGRALLRSGPGRRLAEAGVVAADGARVVVRRPLLTDEVARTVLSLSPGEC